MEDKLSKIEKILDLVDQEYVKPQEMSEVLGAVADAVVENRNQAVAGLAQLTQDTNDEVERLDGRIDAVDTKVSRTKSELEAKIQLIELTPGEKGDKGDKGEQGEPGKDGKDGTDATVDEKKIIEEAVKKAKDEIKPVQQVVNRTVFGGGGGVEVHSSGTNVVQRAKSLNFVGATATSTNGQDVTVTVTGGGAVDSVNGQTGVVVLDADDISDTTTTNKFATAAEKTKLGHISITQAVDLDALETASHAAVTLAGEDFLSITGQQITANAIDLDNLSATGTPSSSTFLRGDNTWATPAGTGDMVLADAQSVTGLKTFDKDKIAMKGTSTGVTTISTANTGASNYTATLKAADGTIAYTSDITGTNSGTNTGDQTITNSSDATSHTVTLSASGGSVQLIEGTGVTLTTGGTASAGTVTIAGTVTQYTDEMAQDAVGNAIGNGLDYDDTSGAISVDETELAVPAANVIMPTDGGSPTLNTLAEDFTTKGSSGVADGTITYVTVGTSATKISVASGEGYIRTTNDQQGELKFCKWAASPDLYTFSAPTAGFENVIFIGIEYSGGTVSAVAKTAFTDWNWYTNFPLARCSYDGTTMRILNAYAHAEDTANLTRKYLRLTMPFTREEAPEGSGGLELSVALRALAMTAGKVWHGFNNYSLGAVASGSAFDTHYKKAGGGFNTTTGVTAYPNTQYDNGSGTLQDLTASKYGTLWVYVDVADGSLDVVYGAVNATSVANAQLDTIPTTPEHLRYHGRLIGRIIFKKSDPSPALVESAWTSAFGASAVGDHALLTNLQGGTAGEYYHLTSAEYTGTGTNNFVRQTTPTLTTPILGVATATSINKVAITAPATAATLTIADGQTLTVNGSATITNGTHSGTNTGDQTISNSSDATSHTVTLSASGGSVQFIEGTNITLTTGGTASAGTVTIAASSGSGDVTKVGTPSNNQVGVWTGDGTLEGDAALTFDTTTDTLTSGVLNATGLTASELVATDASKNLSSLAVATYPSLAEIAHVKGVTSAIQTQLNGKAPALGADDNYVTNVEKAALHAAGSDDAFTVANEATDTSCFPLFVTAATGDLGPKTNANLTFNSSTGALGSASLNLSGLTASELVATDGSKNLSSLAVATYPSLTEISYVKGVTSAIQTQLNGKAAALGADDNYVTDAEKSALHAAGSDDTFTVANEAADTTCFPLFVTAATGDLGPRTNASLTYNSTNGTLAATTFVGALTGTASGNLTSGGALGTPSSGTLTNCTGLPVNGIVDDTTSALGVGTLELGHASDTTLSRSAAGTLAVEGVDVLTTSNTKTVSNKTLSGAIPLEENASIDLDPALSADGKYSGICITGTAGAALSFGDLIYLAAADSRWELADADAATTADRMLGICVLAAAGDGSATKILLQGNIRADAAFPALTIGAPVYVGETAGDVQTAIPTGADNVIRRVGYALTADSLYFNPSMDSQTTVA